MKPFLSVITSITALAAWAGALSAEELRVEDSTVSRVAASGLSIVSGRVTLPSKGVWELASPLSAEAPVQQAQLMAPPDVLEAMFGRRGMAIQRLQATRAIRHSMMNAYGHLREFAAEHEGRMPQSLSELSEKARRDVEAALSRPPEPLTSDMVPASPPYYAIVRDSVLLYDESMPERRYRAHATPTNDVPVIVELHPLENDGKHWVLTSRYRTERLPIDVEMLSRIGAVVTPMLSTGGDRNPTAAYRLAALLRAPGEVSIALTNRYTHASAICRWEISGELPVKDDVSMVRDWATRRAGFWRRLAGDTDAPGLKVWSSVQDGMFGVDLSSLWRQGRRDDRGGQQTDMFGMFGGRAAMRETLQLQALRPSGSGALGASVPVASIKGVDVKSHPFAEMLAGREGGSLPLTERVPHDRFLVYISKPEALLPLLDRGSEFLGHVGAGATGRALFYDLKARYFARLGVSEAFVRALVEQGLFRDMALFVPDLFFIEGTDLTAIVRGANAEQLAALVTLAGVATAQDGKVTAIPTTSGGEAYWAVDGELVIASTSRRELEAALALGASGGEGSLGRSEEFRYMLTCLPQTDSTRVYSYFSDAFIRHLVGPEVKIGQLRRLQTKSAMEIVAYAAMLHAYDGSDAPGDLESLKAAGYLPKGMNVAGISLGDAGTVESDDYGSLTAMHPLSVVPVTNATPAEAAAYEAYRERYTRYWRRFFDPIAIRVDDAGSGTLEMTTYILPLIENSLYDGLRRFVRSDSGSPLMVPALDPAPVGMVSVGISESAWQEGLSEMWGQMALTVGADLGMLDDMGPGFPFAVFDSEPVIAAGSRSFLGLGGRFGDIGEMGIPAYIALLTRPCVLAVELKRIDRVQAFLESGNLPRLMPRVDRGMQPTYYRVDGEDAWVIGLDAMGLAIRFRLELSGRYLLLSNMPWRGGVDVTGEATAAAEGGSLRLFPGSVEEELAAMFMAAMEGVRSNVHESLAYLAPFTLMGMSPKKAAAACLHRFGFAPRFPEGCAAVVEQGVPACPGFGSLYDPHQPDVGAGPKEFGVFRDIENIEASFQFEDTGLRTVVQWRLRD